MNYVKTVGRKIYEYDLYSPSKQSPLHTHTHTHRVLHDSSARHHQTTLNNQIFTTAKLYRPISGQRILVSFWIALPWRWNQCDPSKWGCLCVSGHGLISQKIWIFSNVKCLIKACAVITYTGTWKLVNVGLSLCYINSANLWETALVSSWLQHRQI